MNKKGQALIEFIIILPIIIFMLFAIIDYGLISYNKNKMENIITNIDKMVHNKESDDDITKYVKENDSELFIDINYNEEKFTSIRLYKKYDYITPGLSKILNIKEIEVERTLYNE